MSLLSSLAVSHRKGWEASGSSMLARPLPVSVMGQAPAQAETAWGLSHSSELCVYVLFILQYWLGI